MLSGVGIIAHGFAARKPDWPMNPGFFCSLSLGIRVSTGFRNYLYFCLSVSYSGSRLWLGGGFISFLRINGRRSAAVGWNETWLFFSYVSGPSSWLTGCLTDCVCREMIVFRFTPQFFGGLRACVRSQHHPHWHIDTLRPLGYVCFFPAYHE